MKRKFGERLVAYIFLVVLPFLMHFRQAAFDGLQSLCTALQAEVMYILFTLISWASGLWRILTLLGSRAYFRVVLLLGGLLYSYL